MPTVYVAAGSNVDAERNLVLATREMQREFPGVRFSPWYRNPAVGFEGDDFINFVAGFDTQLPPDALLDKLHAIEALCGRPRDAPRWAPRTMDLDVLLYGDLLSEEPRLRLPRPDLLTRAFMLGPLAALAPDLLHPTLQLTMAQLWQRFDRQAHPLIEVAPPTSLRFDPHPPPGSGR